MNVRYQMFIILAFIYSSYSLLAIESDKWNQVYNRSESSLNRSNNCECDVLQIYSPAFGTYNFTKQNDTHNDKPIYFSTSMHMISWDNKSQHWFCEKYEKKVFNLQQTLDPFSFSFENLCENVTREVYWNK